MVSAHTGRTAEPVYRPILTAGRSELEALGHLDTDAAALVVPILTLTDGDSVDLPRRLPAGLTVAVDLAGLPGTGPLLGLLRQGVPLVPVIGFAERDDRLVAQGAAARSHLGWAVLRLRLRVDPYGPDAATGAAERIWRRTGLMPEQCDLLLDVGEVCCAADLRTAEPRVRRLVDWARRHAWRSVTVAAGAMPPALPGLPDGEPVRLARWDWLLWQKLTGLGLGYGDYGIRSATPGPPERLPAMRYTADEAWWIYRWSRRGGRGDDRVAELCRAVVSASHWPAAGAGFSWGDHEIVRRARGAAGAGSATSWAAWGTSHHLAHVLATLRQPGVPPVRPTPHRGRSERADGHRARGPHHGGRPGWPPRGGQSGRSG
ncbi:Beta protein [Micromonospora pallida]|uniref:Beta protein n=1 Tax=Micromonospora pallida TaxID=145854 RepID=A0A1C6T0A9_9ACTN|nr:beta family protein [Micromonospora pallida]SCL34775.1 Beta protein [Micromonospora pallida]